MRAFTKILAILLLAIPFALLMIFNAPGLGILLAIFMAAFIIIMKAQKSSAIGKLQGIEQHRNATYKKAA